MLGIRTTTLSLIFAAIAVAQPPDYLPLATGNAWVYRAGGRLGQQVQTVSVGEKVIFDSKEYYRVSFFGRTVNLRKADTGDLFEFDEQETREKPWILFSSPDGGSFDTSLDPCTTTGSIQARNAKHSSVLGDFDNTLKLGYRGRCADAGVTEQVFLPYIGLLEHVTDSIAGPVRYQLTYARSGVVQVTGSEVSFTVALDSIVYPPSDTAEALVRMTLRNQTSEPITLNFRSGQSFDVVIRNQADEIVYVWSSDKLFPAVYRTEQVTGERNWAVAVPVGRLAPGKYSAEAYLTTDTPMRTYAGSTAFEIRR